MKLIDKDAVLAIIEKELSYYKDLEDREIISDCGIACYRVVRMLKSDIESLEMKEVDLDKPFEGVKVQTSMESGSLDEVIVTTKYKAKKGEEYDRQRENNSIYR